MSMRVGRASSSSSSSLSLVAPLFQQRLPSSSSSSSSRGNLSSLLATRTKACGGGQRQGLVVAGILSAGGYPTSPSFSFSSNSPTHLSTAAGGGLRQLFQGRLHHPPSSAIPMSSSSSYHSKVAMTTTATTPNNTSLTKKKRKKKDKIIRRCYCSTIRSNNLFGTAATASIATSREDASKKGTTATTSSKRSTTSSSTTTTTKSQLTYADTPLGKSPHFTKLTDGLDLYTVPSNIDEHPLTVYGIQSQNIYPNHTPHECRHPILLLHGRTWSSIPVYHLLGGSQQLDESCDHESHSLMEALYHKSGGYLQPYCFDFRGFGGTPSADETHSVHPHVCISDVESVLMWIARRHGFIFEEDDDDDGDGGGEDVGKKTTKEEEEGENKDDDTSCHKCELPALLGWSQGALVAQLAAQRSPHLLSKLVLYGSIYDPLVRYPRAPLYGSNRNGSSTSGGGGGDGLGNDEEQRRIRTTFDDAIEDFTIEGSIAPEMARHFADTALISDPYKPNWQSLHEFNNVDPARVHVPTLVVAGDQDPYSPLRAQKDLFCNLGRGSDRCWSIMSGADHAVHLLDGQHRFVQIVKTFVESGR